MTLSDFTSLFGHRSDDRGVSPAIGVILMVAVTVMLAAILGTFVLGSVSGLAQDEPLVSFEMTQDGTTVVLSHMGGDTLDGENVYLVSESNGSLGNYAGTDGQACDTTISTIKPGTECSISGAPSGELSVVRRAADFPTILFKGWVLDYDSSSEPTAAEFVEAVQTDGVDTQSSEIVFTIENTDSDTVTIVDFSVDATRVNNDIWIDDGNKGNPEFETSGATDDGRADNPDRKEDSFLANGTTYRLEDNNGENVELAASDDSVTVTLETFLPDDNWIDDSDELEFVDEKADADVIISFGLSDGSNAEFYLSVV